MNENEKIETAETTEPTEPETAETEPETDESTTAQTYGGIAPLGSVAELFTDESWDDAGDENLSPEKVESMTTRLAKDAVQVVKATDSLANRFRRMCTALLTIRAGIIITRADGSVGPDWEGTSYLAKRYSTMVITKPLYDAGLADRLDYVQRTISAYYSKKVPGENNSLRDKFIRDWVTAHATAEDPETGEPIELDGVAVENRVDAEFAAFDKKSDRVKKNDAAAARANVGGPGQGQTPKNPVDALVNASTALVQNPADVKLEVLIEQAHKLLSRVALQIRRNNGEIQDRPAVQAAWDSFQDLSAAITETLDGRRESWDNLQSALFGTPARDAWASIVKAEAEAKDESTEAETAETTAETAESTETAETVA